MTFFFQLVQSGKGTTLINVEDDQHSSMFDQWCYNGNETFDDYEEGTFTPLIYYQSGGHYNI